MTLATFVQTSAHLLDGIADGSVQAIVTSPPYYGLRAYAGEQAVEWPAVEYAPMPGLPSIHIAGCEPGCVHEWTDIPPQYQRGKVGDNSTLQGGPMAGGVGRVQTLTQGAYCAKCGGWRGGLGNEPTLEAYIGHLVLCLRRWREVLRDDGIAFVNLGDSYAGSGKGQMGDGSASDRKGAKQGTSAGTLTGGLVTQSQNGLKPKDLMQVPARFALAAQADGWWLRSDIIGAKVAPMPESVTDRPTRSHEHVFMLTKAARYYWDAEGVREKALQPEGVAKLTAQHKRAVLQDVSSSTLGTNQGASTRNMRDVIEWRPSPFPGAHFATWPEAIPEKLIRAATSERGACPHCGAPWARVVEKGPPKEGIERGKHPSALRANIHGPQQSCNGGLGVRDTTTLGFTPSCTCPPHDPVPCIVLDPFSGSGTTAKVAVRLGRRVIGVDIAAEYLTDVTAQRFGAGVQMELVSA